MSWRRAVCLSMLLGGCTAIAPFGSLTTRDGGEDAPLGDDGGTGGTKRVFLSSEGYFANLRGLDGADARCSALAAAQGLGSDYVAWLSAGGVGPIDRFDRTAGPYVRVDGRVVAEDWDDLTDGVLTHLIELDERGMVISDGGAAWTGTSYDGTPTADGADCEGWTVETFEGRGAIGAYDDDEFGAWSHWDNVGPFPCQNPFHLYCFER